MSDAYVDKIFLSFTGSFSGSTLTKERWLDGESGWRIPLHRIGQMAAAVNSIEHIAVARREWGLRLSTYEWVEGYLAAVPLLSRAATHANQTDELFREFMKNLATLATL